MIENEAYRERKLDRERRLGWQSHMLLTIVLLPAAGGVVAAALPVLTPASAEGFTVCAAFGLMVYALRAATPLAAVAGFVLTACLYLGTVVQPDGGWFHTALLSGFTLFVLAFAATRFRRSQKEQGNLAESRRGRGASQVAANMGVAAMAALWPFLALRTHPDHTGLDPRWVLFTPMIAALAEAAADTIASEIGQAIGGTPMLLTTGRRVPPGTDGAVTLAGSAAGCAAAAIVVLVAIPTLRLTSRQAAIAFAAGVGGLFSDSLIGATLENRGWLNNDAVNFLSTAIAALLALIGS